MRDPRTCDASERTEASLDEGAADPHVLLSDVTAFYFYHLIITGVVKLRILSRVMFFILNCRINFLILIQTNAIEHLYTIVLTSRNDKIFMTLSSCEYLYL